MTNIKLAKVLAQAGIASRRKSETYIEAGRVTVNGQIEKNVARRVDPNLDTVEFDGTTLSNLAQPDHTIVLALHKPAGFVSTASDPDGKPTVMEFIPRQYAQYRLFPVGRLDEESEGLILLTNDGDLAYTLTHPKFEIPKTYHVWIAGRLTKGELERLRTGIWLREKGVTKKTQPAVVSILNNEQEMEIEDDMQHLEITITEGLHRQVRRMCKAVNHEVIRLKRIRFGNYELGDLASGKIRVEYEH